MDRRDFFRRGAVGGVFALVTAAEVEAELAEVPASRLAEIIPDKLAAVWLDGPDMPPTLFAREGYVNMSDLVNMRPGSIVRFR